MPLSSQLFARDPKLEAAANADAAHIMMGARGSHVEKIQSALNVLDNAGLVVDGAYGAATANAVLKYKSKKNVVNRSYQSSADNIVGKMTMTALDKEMREYEAKPPRRIKFIPVSPRANGNKAYPKLGFEFTKGKTLAPVRSDIIKPIETITIDPMGIAKIDIEHGDGYDIAIGSSTYGGKPLAVMLLPGIKDPVYNFSLHAGTDTYTIQVRAGDKWGTAVLYGRHHQAGEELSALMLIYIRDPRATVWHPTDAHHHEPVSEPDEWNKVCEEAAKDPDLGFWLTRLARNNASPETVAGAAVLGLMFARMGQWHYQFYLNGTGAVVNEDQNLKEWIEGDDHARKVISRRIREERRGSESPVSVMFEFDQKLYGTNDARMSFGTIDNLEAKADWLAGTVDIWFEDTYEWHPTYSQYTTPAKCQNPAKRDTNFLHAALVQMKKRGAKDYQMRGKATFPMRLFPGL